MHPVFVFAKSGYWRSEQPRYPKNQGSTEIPVVAVSGWHLRPCQGGGPGKATVLWEKSHGNTGTLLICGPARTRHMWNFTLSRSHISKREKNQVKLILTYNIIFSPIDPEFCPFSMLSTEEY